MTNQGAIDVRLRLCETGATEQKLLSVMYGYTIDVFMASPQWNPYGDPLPPAPELGKPGPDMLPAGPDQFATVTTPVPLARRAKRPSRPAGSQEQAAPPAAAVQPSGPRVPAPPAKPGSDEAAEPAAQAPLVPPPPAEE